ncbi:ABC transporter permease [Hydrogenibacillus schlegelii]|uniref:ABC transporter permease n=1 Tax=Hydrogenibacillus schlegelii TaxID=1484 RepID=UPI00082492B5|nr:ABC transporter permease [Hydrogenibacillus schlegelii]
MALWIGSLEQGLLFGIMAIGVYLTFRVLSFPDLTVDGSFALGGAVAASLVVAGVSGWAAAAVAALAGAGAGLITGLLHTKGKINGLLSGILTMIALYSVNLRVMGRANVSLLNEKTIKTELEAWAQAAGVDRHVVFGVMFFLLLFAVKLAVDWFLRTDLGTAVRATGDNPAMIRSFGVDTDGTILLGLILSNALVGLSGGLIAQYQGYADVQMGIGMIIVGLASVIIGEVLIGAQTIFRATLAAAAGAVAYRFVIAAALRLNVDPNDLKLLTALIVVVALVVPPILEKRRLQRRLDAEDADAVFGDDRRQAAADRAGAGAGPKAEGRVRPAEKGGEGG